MADSPELHSDWSSLQEQVLKELPPDVSPGMESDWNDYQSRVLAKLRPPHRPATEEEWKAFRHQVLSQMLIRPWLDSKCVTLIPAGKWAAFTEGLPAVFQPVTWKELDYDAKILKSSCKRVWRISDAIISGKLAERMSYLSRLRASTGQDFVSVPEDPWQLHEKKFLWKLEAYLQPITVDKRTLDPENRADLLQAVQIGNEAEKRAERVWRARILPRLPAHLQPADTRDESNREWMRLDCQVLAQMPLKPRLDFDGKKTPEWQAKEEEWADWQKITALKLLNRYEIMADQWESEYYALSHIPGYPTRSDEDEDARRRHEYREWSKRIYIQLPLNLRPPTPQPDDEWPLGHRAEWPPLTAGVDWQTLIRERRQVEKARTTPPWE